MVGSHLCLTKAEGQGVSSPGQREIWLFLNIKNWIKPRRPFGNPSPVQPAIGRTRFLWSDASLSAGGTESVWDRLSEPGCLLTDSVME